MALSPRTNDTLNTLSPRVKRRLTQQVGSHIRQREVAAVEAAFDHLQQSNQDPERRAAVNCLTQASENGLERLDKIMCWKGRRPAAQRSARNHR